MAIPGMPGWLDVESAGALLAAAAACAGVSLWSAHALRLDRWFVRTVPAHPMPREALLRGVLSEAEKVANPPMRVQRACWEGPEALCRRMAARAAQLGGAGASVEQAERELRVVEAECDLSEAERASRRALSVAVVTTSAALGALGFAVLAGAATPAEGLVTAVAGLLLAALAAGTGAACVRGPRADPASDPAQTFERAALRTALAARAAGETPDQIAARVRGMFPPGNSDSSDRRAA